MAWRGSCFACVLKCFTVCTNICVYSWESFVFYVKYKQISKPEQINPQLPWVFWLFRLIQMQMQAIFGIDHCADSAYMKQWRVLGDKTGHVIRVLCLL